MPDMADDFRRVTVRIPTSVYVELVLAKVLTRKSFNALLADAIMIVAQRYRAEAQRDAGEATP